MTAFLRTRLLWRSRTRRKTHSVNAVSLASHGHRACRVRSVIHTTTRYASEVTSSSFHGRRSRSCCSTQLPHLLEIDAHVG